MRLRKMHIAAAAALMNAVALGIAATYSATATEDMKKATSSIRPSKNEISWIGSFLAIGALFGGIVAGYLANKLGRKGVLLFNSVPFLIGWLLISYATSVNFIYGGRFLTGFCCGIVSVATPVYLVEISTPEVRGRLGASFQLYIVIGVLIVSSLGAVLSWNWLAIAGAFFSIIPLAVLSPMPESPRWLVAHGKHVEAVNAIKFFQGDYVDASTECIAIDEELRLQPKGGVTLRELLQPIVYKPALLSIGLVFFQQFSGSNAVLFYTVAIFSQATQSFNPNLENIFVALVLVIATFLSSILMDKVGRKILLLISGFFMFLSLAVLGSFSFVATTHQTLRQHFGWIPLVCLMVYVAAFSLGFGPIPWLMMPEMTPIRARGAVCGAGTAFCWTFVFIITKTFTDLENAIHNYGAFWFYGGFCLLSCFFSVFLLPETKGKPLEEIQDYFAGGRSRVERLSETESIDCN